MPSAPLPLPPSFIKLRSSRRSVPSAPLPLPPSFINAFTIARASSRSAVTRVSSFMAAASRATSSPPVDAPVTALLPSLRDCSDFCALRGGGVGGCSPGGHGNTSDGSMRPPSPREARYASHSAATLLDTRSTRNGFSSSTTLASSAVSYAIALADIRSHIASSVANASFAPPSALPTGGVM